MTQELTEKSIWQKVWHNWYKWVPISVSVLALIASFWQAGVRQSMLGISRTEIVRSKAEVFRTEILALEQLISTSLNTVQNPLLDANLYGIDPLASPAARIHYETAKKLESEIESQPTFAEYLVLAHFSCTFSGFDEAEIYVRKAVRQIENGDHNPNSKAVAYASLGTMYFRFYPAVPAATR